MTSFFSKSPFLFAEGVLWTMGNNSASQLGRLTRNDGSQTFGPVSMAEPILAVASGALHCLAMTADKVRYARVMVGVTFKTSHWLRLSDYKGDYHTSKSSLQHGYLINNAQFWFCDKLISYRTSYMTEEISRWRVSYNLSCLEKCLLKRRMAHSCWPNSCTKIGIYHVSLELKYSLGGQVIRIVVNHYFTSRAPESTP